MKLKLSFFVLFAVSSAVSAQAATDPTLSHALQHQQDQIIQLPGIKSFSEIHDRQMQIYEKVTEIRLTQESKYQIVTIPGSFAKSYANALIGILDVGNWSSNWNNYIKPSYKVRQEQNNRLGE